jgi:hypothetical protein
MHWRWLEPCAFHRPAHWDPTGSSTASRSPTTRFRSGLLSEGGAICPQQLPCRLHRDWWGTSLGASPEWWAPKLSPTPRLRVPLSTAHKTSQSAKPFHAASAQRNDDRGCGIVVDVRWSRCRGGVHERVPFPIEALAPPQGLCANAAHYVTDIAVEADQRINGSTTLVPSRLAALALIYRLDQRQHHVRRDYYDHLPHHQQANPHAQRPLRCRSGDDSRHGRARFRIIPAVQAVRQAGHRQEGAEVAQ